mmetsp:Transcript_13715/g.38820  ORF Transcript_13715/g.38820 Transcript_13715/m.38820 type:complete len:103 (-) Transcript_13715:80-388(-)
MYWTLVPRNQCEEAAFSLSVQEDPYHLWRESPQGPLVRFSRCFNMLSQFSADCCATRFNTALRHVFSLFKFPPYIVGSSLKAAAAKLPPLLQTEFYLVFRSE